MRSILFVAAILSLSGCAEFTGAGPGNPDGTAYAGSPDSVYSVAANPPQTVGVVVYDPAAVQPEPVDVIPTPSGGNAMNNTLPAQDYGPAAGNPARPATH